MSEPRPHPDRSREQDVRLPVSGVVESDRARSLYLIVLFLLAVIPYLNTLFNGFVYDDNTQVLNNPYILNFRHLRAIFTTTAWSYQGGAVSVTNYYRPLMTVGYLFCHALFGMLAYGYHLMNVLLYAGSTLLVFAVTARMFKRRDVAFLAAAVFALHPVHTETVAWIAGVTGLELTVFYLLAFWFFLRLPQAGGRRSDGAMLGMMVSFLLALLSKEQAMTFPALATFYEYTCREDRHQTSWSGKLARYGPLWLLAVAYWLFRVNVLGGFAPVIQLPNFSWAATLFSALALVAQYAGKLFWPVRLCAFYVFHPSSRLADPRVIAGLGVLGAGLVLFFACWNRARPISFALAWFIATLAPVLNARWMSASVFSERYLNLPSIGFCWLIAWVGIQVWDAVAAVSPPPVLRVNPLGAEDSAATVLRVKPFGAEDSAATVLRVKPLGAEVSAAIAPPSKLSRRFARRSAARLVLAAVACLIAIAAAMRIVIRNRDWRNDIALYTKTLAQSPDANQILNNLGTVYWQRGQTEEARRCWERALALRPSKDIFLNNLGLYYTRRRRYAEAESYYRRAMLAKPNYADAHFNLGSLLLQEGKWPQAELQLRAAIALSPLNSDAHNEMAKLDLATARPDAAEAEFKKSLAAKPNITALEGLGKMEMQAGRFSRAKREFQRALKLNTYDSQARFGVAALDASAGHLQEAITEYEAGLRSDPKNALALAALEKLKLNLDHDRSSPR
ncbi:MAG: tetratricopeptide repeat protein [Terriglobia bacterium]